METKVIYPGTFDPLTVGHLDLIHRSIKIFDQLTVAVAADMPKTPLFSLDERVEMVKLATQGLPKVKVDAFSGLLVDYLRRSQAHVVLRGLRVLSDFEYEFQLAQMNRKLDPEFEIVYMLPDERYTSISASLVKEIASLGGDVSEFVPEAIHRRLLAKFSRT